jgi:hypothetical protein
MILRIATFGQVSTCKVDSMEGTPEEKSINESSSRKQPDAINRGMNGDDTVD